MAKDAFLMYVDDWLSSGRIELMDAHEERGYFRLLLRAWKQEDCGLPTDELTLAAWSKMGTQWFRETADRNLRQPGVTSGQKVMACFVERNSRLFNERQLKEFTYQQSYFERQKKNGGLGGRPKKEPTDNPLVNPEKPTGYFQGNPLDNPGITQKNQTETETETSSLSTAEPKKKKRVRTAITVEMLPDEWAQFSMKELKWDIGKCEFTFHGFRDYWLSRGDVMADWFAAWRNWCRKDLQSKTHQPLFTQQPQSAAYKPYVDPFKGMQ